MNSEWQFIIVFVVLAPIFPLAPIIVNRILGPSRPNPVKQQTYECGIETVGDTWVQFKVQYYIFALVFLVFDVETVFLFPWAVNFRALGLFGFIEMMIFLGILLLGYAYLWRNGGLQWD